MSKETNVLDGQRVSHLSAYFLFWWTFTITIKSSYALHFCPENVQLNKMVISCFWMHVLSRVHWEQYSDVYGERWKQQDG